MDHNLEPLDPEAGAALRRMYAQLDPRAPLHLALPTPKRSRRREALRRIVLAWRALRGGRAGG